MFSDDNVTPIDVAATLAWLLDGHFNDETEVWFSANPNGAVVNCFAMIIDNINNGYPFRITVERA